MKISKWIDFSREVEIEIDSEDISVVFKDGDGDYKLLAHNINRMAVFLKAVPEETVAEMPESMKAVVAEFFREQAERFSAPTKP